MKQTKKPDAILSRYECEDPTSNARILPRYEREEMASRDAILSRYECEEATRSAVDTV